LNIYQDQHVGTKMKKKLQIRNYYCTLCGYPRKMVYWVCGIMHSRNTRSTKGVQQCWYYNYN